MPFLNELNAEFEKERNPENSIPMAAYMKHKFSFLGIKSPERKGILRKVVNNHKTELKDQLDLIVKDLYALQEREYHYCAMEICARFKKRQYQLSDIALVEILITTHSHWDTVDFIAKHIYGQYLKEHPEQVNLTVEKFTNSENMWLNRSAILFQLGYKETTDSDLLFALCDQHKSSKEFFIQKAIGWSLREYC